MTTEQKDPLEAEIQAKKDELKEMKAKLVSSKKERREAKKKAREEESLRLEVEESKVQAILDVIYQYKRLGKAAKKEFNILPLIKDDIIGVDGDSEELEDEEA